MKAGFSRREITPPPGTGKIGWLQEVIGTRVADPLYARAVAVEDGTGSRVAVIVLDVLSVPWKFVMAVREGIRSVRPDRVMVCATHSHAGPAVARAGVVPRDEVVTAMAVRQAAQAVEDAVSELEPVTLSIGVTEERSVTFNRRVMMKDGTARTHGSLKDPEAVGLEGPIDPEVRVLAFRSLTGAPVGMLVHHALHPTDHGGDEVFSAGWPGHLCASLESAGWPHAMFIQGALGNVHTQDPSGTVKHSPEQVGVILAAAALRAEAVGSPGADLVAAISVDLRLPYRNPTAEEVGGTVRGAQRFIDPAIYDSGMPRLLEKIQTNGSARATLQAIRIGRAVLAGLPGEPFVELGLSIKSGTWAGAVILPVGCANGMLGYVPTREAFTRGGYETTFIASSKLAPESGDLLVAAARDLCSRI